MTKPKYRDLDRVKVNPINRYHPSIVDRSREIQRLRIKAEQLQNEIFQHRESKAFKLEVGACEQLADCKKAIGFLVFK